MRFTARNSVLFPHPEGPKMVTNSPLRTDKFTSFSTVFSPKKEFEHSQIITPAGLFHGNVADSDVPHHNISFFGKSEIILKNNVGGKNVRNLRKKKRDD